jgi:hypothetical protein
MNHFKARQRDTDMRWDYTCMNDGVVWPMGYCCEFREPNDDLFEWPEWEKRLMRANKDKFHNNGHATAEEASKCYKSHQLDFRLRLDGVTHKTQHPCEICQEWTQKTASVGAWHQWHLCDKHLNRESVEELFYVGESWSS